MRAPSSLALGYGDLWEAHHPSVEGASDESTVVARSRRHCILPACLWQSCRARANPRSDFHSDCCYDTCSSRCTVAHAGRPIHSGSDENLHSNPQSRRDTDCHSTLDCCSNGHRDRHAQPYRHTVANSDRDLHAVPQSLTNADSDGHRDSHADPDSHAHAQPHC